MDDNDKKRKESRKGMNGKRKSTKEKSKSRFQKQTIATTERKQEEKSVVWSDEIDATHEMHSTCTIWLRCTQGCSLNFHIERSLGSRHCKEPSFTTHTT